MSATPKPTPTPGTETPGTEAVVGFNLLWLVPGVVGGSEELIVALLEALAASPSPDLRYRLYALEPFAAAHPRLAEQFPTRLLPLRGRLKPLRVLAEGTWLRRATQRDGVDLVHHAGGTFPLGSGLPGVVTMHDLQPFDLPDNFHPAKRLYLHRAIPRAVRKAELVLVQSDFVGQGVIDRFGVAPARVRRVPPAVRAPSELEVSADDVRKRYDLPDRWFVYPAITYPHKNHVSLVRAFARVAEARVEDDVALVLTGGEAGSETALRDEIARLGLTGRVRRTGRIPRADLLGLVAGSAALTFPSRYEGFGLPVLEAMAYGTPVVASSATALPEVVGEAGLLVEPDDIEGWSDAMLAVLTERGHARLAEAGRRRAAQLSWAATAAATAEAHRDVLDALRRSARGNDDVRATR
jgi:glycosyltransferase involved in cell wall biosynthesis